MNKPWCPFDSGTRDCSFSLIFSLSVVPFSLFDEKRYNDEIVRSFLVWSVIPFPEIPRVSSSFLYVSLFPLPFFHFLLHYLYPWIIALFFLINHRSSSFVYCRVFYALRRFTSVSLWLCRMFGSSGWLVSIGMLIMGVLLSLAQADYPPPGRLTGMNPCISKQTCHECIQTPHCAWCAAPVSFYSITFTNSLSLFFSLFYTFLFIKLF